MDERIRPDVERLLLDGRKIEAIKLVRETTGLGLKDAKDLVEAFQEELRGDPDTARRMDERRSGCLGAVLLVGIGLTACGALLM